MIKSKKGRVHIKGKPNEVIADLVCTINACRKCFDSHGLNAEEAIKFAIETSLLPTEELKSEKGLKSEENEDGDSVGEKN